MRVMRFGKLILACGLLTSALSISGQAPKPKPATGKPTEQSAYFNSWDNGEIKRCQTYSGYTSLLVCDWEDSDWKGSLINLMGDAAGQHDYDVAKGNIDRMAELYKESYESGDTDFKKYQDQQLTIAAARYQAEVTLIQKQSDARKATIASAGRADQNMEEYYKASLNYMLTHSKNFLISFSEEAWPKPQTGLTLTMWRCTKGTTITCKLESRAK